MKGLYERNIVAPLPAAEFITHNGRVLASGALGVAKGKQVWSAGRQRMVEVVRLIINMTPANE
eukprot:9452121-Lingulodinium_polyedra.AAC.1